MSESSTEFDSESVLRIVTHMNKDHADALLLYLSAFSSVDAGSVRDICMTDIDANGISLNYKLGNEPSDLRIQFIDTIGSPISAPAEARKALVDMVQLANLGSHQ